MSKATAIVTPVTIIARCGVSNLPWTSSSDSGSNPSLAIAKRYREAASIPARAIEVIARIATTEASSAASLPAISCAKALTGSSMGRPDASTKDSSGMTETIVATTTA